MELKNKKFKSNKIYLVFKKINKKIVYLKFKDCKSRDII